MTRAFALAALAAAGCAQQLDCKPGTLLLVVDGARGADQLTISLHDDQGHQAQESLLLEGRAGGNLEVDFAKYPIGAVMSWEVTATVRGVLLDRESGTVALAWACSRVAVHVGRVADGGAGGGADLARPLAPDLGPVGCTASFDCDVSQVCVDGICCDQPCDGACESCRVPGHVGTCVPIPAPGPLGTCGTGPCAGACDGVQPTCVYPTSSCRPDECAGGVATRESTCSSGTCQSGGSEMCAGGVCGDSACAQVVEMCAGLAETCAVLTDGTVACWGMFALPGPILVTDPHLPVRIPGITHAAHVACGPNWVCAALSDGTVQCWGENYDGELGIGSVDNMPHGPSAVLTSPSTPLTGVVQIAGGILYACAVTSSRAAYCWGSTNNVTAGLVGGSGSVTPYAQPVCARDRSCVPADDVVEVAPAVDHVCYRATDGAVACWGDNSAGQCGSIGAASQPKTVAGVTANHVASGSAASCALVGDGSGKVVCWGSNYGGTLGLGGTDSNPHPSPSSVCAEPTCNGALTAATDVSVGDGFACAVLQGRVTCWGQNNHGQLMTGDTANRFYGQGPDPASPAAARAWSGGSFACSNDPIGGPRCWGADDHRQLGDGDTADKVLPVAPALGK